LEGNSHGKSKFQKLSEKFGSQPEGYSGKQFHDMKNFENLDKIIIKSQILIKN